MRTPQYDIALLASLPFGPRRLECGVLELAAPTVGAAAAWVEGVGLLLRGYDEA